MVVDNLSSSRLQSNPQGVTSIRVAIADKVGVDPMQVYITSFTDTGKSSRRRRRRSMAEDLIGVLIEYEIRFDSNAGEEKITEVKAKMRSMVSSKKESQDILIAIAKAAGISEEGIALRVSTPTETEVLRANAVSTTKHNLKSTLENAEAPTAMVSSGVRGQPVLYFFILCTIVL